MISSPTRPLASCSAQTFLRAALATLVSGIALWLAARNANLEGVRSALARARFTWLLAYPVLCIVLNLVRGEIWRILLRRRAGTLEAFWAYSVGFVANNVLPFRLGEAARVVVLSSRIGVPIVETGAAAGLERLLDLAMLSIMLAMLGPALVHVHGVGRGAVLVALLVGLALAVIIAITVWQERLESFLTRAVAWMPTSVGTMVIERSRELARGLRVMVQPSIAAPALAGAAVVWILTVFLQWLVLRAFQPSAGAADAAFMVAVVSLASALPAAPGFVGVYHWAGQLSLMSAFPQMYDASTALAAATVAHAASYVTSTAIGFVGLWRLGMAPSAVARVASGRIDTTAPAAVRAHIEVPPATSLS